MWPAIAAAGLRCGRLILYLETNTLIAKAVMRGEFLEAVDIFRHGFRQIFFMIHVPIVFHSRTLILNFSCGVLCHLYSQRNVIKFYMIYYRRHKTLTPKGIICM